MRSQGNLPLSSRCNSSLCNRRRSPGNLHYRRRTRPGNLCLKMRFLIVFLGQNRNKSGVPMLSEADLEDAGPNCARLHAYFMEHSKDKLAFLAMVDQDYFQGGGALMLNIAFSGVYNLITMTSLDVTFLRLWTLYVS
jgi:hypothetical protein